MARSQPQEGFVAGFVLRFGECHYGFLGNNMNVRLVVANNMHHGSCDDRDGTRVSACRSSNKRRL